MHMSTPIEIKGTSTALGELYPAVLPVTAEPQVTPALISIVRDLFFWFLTSLFEVKFISCRSFTGEVQGRFSCPSPCLPG